MILNCFAEQLGKNPLNPHIFLFTIYLPFIMSEKILCTKKNVIRFGKIFV